MKYRVKNTLTGTVVLFAVFGVFPSFVTAQDGSTPKPIQSVAPTLQVRGFQFKGATVFSTEELMLSSNARLLHTYDIAGLQGIADAITAHYRRSGYMVARAWLSPQAIQDEVVTFQIFEGHLSPSEPIRVVSKFTEVDSQRVYQIAKQSLCQDLECAKLPLTQRRLDRAALLASELTGYQVKAELVPGQALGTTTLLLKVEPRTFNTYEFPRKNYAVELALDNFGTQATGTNRGHSRLAVSDMLQDGDQVVVSYMTTNKTDIQNFALDYSLAVGNDGWRMGAGTAKTQYTLAAGFGGFAGDAKTVNIFASYPILRVSDATIDFRFDYDHIHLSDISIAPENRQLKIARIGFSGESRGDDATSSWGISMAQSDLAYDDDRTVAVTSSVGGHHKFTARLSTNRAIDNTGWYVGANAFGQHASGNLDSYGKLFLGGAYAVRAYASGEVGGDSAVVGQLALGKSGLGNYAGSDVQTDLSVFYDRGWARLQHTPAASVAGNDVIRAGWGLEAKVSQKDKYALRAFWAKGRSGVSTIDNKQSRVGLSLAIAF